MGRRHLPSPLQRDPRPHARVGIDLDSELLVLPRGYARTGIMPGRTWQAKDARLDLDAKDALHIPITGDEVVAPVKP